MLALALTIVACGDAPLAVIGDRSSKWINEPEVTTTTRPIVEVPIIVGMDTLQWHNDDIVSENLDDPTALVGEIFARREGNRYVQSSRAEIAAIVPEIQFPTQAPFGAEWVSSQLVIENNGRVSAEPTAAFGIWSTEPYRVSRQVAQMAVLTVSHDPVTAAELALPGAEFSCARFAERITDECRLLTLGDRDVWKLVATGGTTLLWFDDEYRYELFGRAYLPAEVLEAMAATTAPLATLTPSTALGG